MSGQGRLLIIKLIKMKDYQLLDFNESMNVVSATMQPSTNQS